MSKTSKVVARDRFRSQLSVSETGFTDSKVKTSSETFKRFSGTMDTTCITYNHIGKFLWLINFVNYLSKFFLVVLFKQAINRLLANTIRLFVIIKRHTVPCWMKSIDCLSLVHRLFSSLNFERPLIGTKRHKECTKKSMPHVFVMWTIQC